MKIDDLVAQKHAKASCVSHVALFSSLRETSNYTKERYDDEIDFIHEPSSYSLERRDALMEDVVEIDSRVDPDWILWSTNPKKSDSLRHK